MIVDPGFSVVVVRCDSGYQSLADLKGKVHAFADPDSTSGYAVPYYNMINVDNIDPKAFFKAIPFSGSHEAGVQGVVQGTFDSASTWQNNDVDGRWQRCHDSCAKHNDAMNVAASARFPHSDAIQAFEIDYDELRRAMRRNWLVGSLIFFSVLFFCAWLGDFLKLLKSRCSR